ncbi:MAG: hypothetical protein IPJ68_03750 [Candidatus Moraniibacteriota bacterium]|nr:MAG: hypothetical protein IPJ68_03750 [Candidatus Moranbacteria bacterium]
MSEDTTEVDLKFLAEPVSPDAVARWQEEFAAAEAKRKRRERQQSEKVTLVVGEHKGCGGSIQYISEFVLACSPEEVRLDASNPMRERVACSCRCCGIAYDPDFPAYRDQVIAYRNREDG